MKTIALLVCLFGFTTVSIAQNLAYKPANPNFGGETFNYQWLLNSAHAQNNYKEDTKQAINSRLIWNDLKVI